MINSSVKENSLAFINTPLQNLRNILQEADSSAQKFSKRTSKFTLNWTELPDERSISKEDLQIVISELKVIAKQYVTKFEVSKIFLDVCKKCEINDNFAITEKLKELVRC